MGILMRDNKEPAWKGNMAYVNFPTIVYKPKAARNTGLKFRLTERVK